MKGTFEKVDFEKELADDSISINHHPACKELKALSLSQRTSDSGNGNHSVEMPIILIKIKVAQMFPLYIYACWSSLTSK